MAARCGSKFMGRGEAVGSSDCDSGRELEVIDSGSADALGTAVGAVALVVTRPSVSDVGRDGDCGRVLFCGGSKGSETKSSSLSNSANKTNNETEFSYLVHLPLIDSL